MGRDMPIEAREVFWIVESGSSPTVTELDNMPHRMVEMIIAYKTVKDVIKYGGRLSL
jgi:hypothetical protein